MSEIFAVYPTIFVDKEVINTENNQGLQALLGLSNNILSYLNKICCK